MQYSARGGINRTTIWTGSNRYSTIGWVRITSYDNHLYSVSFIFSLEFFTLGFVFNFRFQIAATVNLRSCFTHLIQLLRKQFYYYGNFLVNNLTLLMLNFPIFMLKFAVLNISRWLMWTLSHHKPFFESFFLGKGPYQIHFFRIAKFYQP
jgi:hypothetical protein